ncbi:hypothetical protein MKX01_026579, partial [Papaver californicum]
MRIGSLLEIELVIEFLFTFHDYRDSQLHYSIRLPNLFNSNITIQGEAEVCGVSVNVDSEDHSEIRLKRFDYFGHGGVTPSHEADGIALTK